MTTAQQNAELHPVDYVSLGLGSVTALAGVVRAFGSSSIEKGLDDTTLKYFAVAGGLLLLQKIKTLSFGDYKLELRDIKATAEEAVEVAKTAESMARTMPATTPPLAGDKAGIALAAAAEKILPGKAEDDPWKGQFGGKTEANGRRLRAVVTEMRDDPDWFRICLIVESSDSKKPLSGSVQFFIHDSFPNSSPVVEVVGGTAELRLTSYGAFTVGALADNGATKLELDLAEDTSFPKRFRNR